MPCGLPLGFVFVYAFSFDPASQLPISIPSYDGTKQPDRSGKPEDSAAGVTKGS